MDKDKLRNTSLEKDDAEVRELQSKEEVKFNIFLGERTPIRKMNIQAEWTRVRSGVI